MLQNVELQKAVSKLLYRSDKQQDSSKLVETFVDVGILRQLSNNNNQIMFGRRGTGKTHIFRVLEAELRNTERCAVCYIDARTLGSSAQFTDPTVPLQFRCVNLFRDFLGEIYNALLEFIVDSGVAQEAYDALEDFGRATTEYVATATGFETESRGLSRVSTGGSLKASIASSAGIAAMASSQKSDESEARVKSSASYENKIIFPAISSALKQILSKGEFQLYILIDEWSSLPFDVQPYLAEFFKRSFLPIATCTLKVAALEYRSNFTLRSGPEVFGFELGSDISSAVDVDDYYVYDRDPTRIAEAFAGILYKHLSTELPHNYLESDLRIGDSNSLPSRLFTARKVFVELVRASEGVARDLLNIFTVAFFDAQRRGADSIDRKAVLEAARTWFETDKSHALDSLMQRALRGIVDEVIGHRNAKSFLLSRELERHEIIQRLFDARVLHLMKKGYAAKEAPGTRYNIYSLDFGTYVDLLRTSKEPEFELTEHEDDDSHAVPFDDNRSIRRIILKGELLEQWYRETTQQNASSSALTPT